MTQYFGKYRGKVENNVDPNQQGRVMVSVPAVTGSGVLNWAMPSVPYAGSGVGFLAIPQIGSNVWVEYEAGDPNAPIWSGCFWDRGGAPTALPIPQVVLIKTETCTLTLSDLPGVGGVTIETKTGMKIVMSDTGLEITNGMAKIAMQGPKITVNNGALEVT